MNPTPDIPLRSCGHCGDPGPYLEVEQPQHIPNTVAVPAWRVVCPYCDARTGWKDCEENAAYAWNQRAYDRYLKRVLLLLAQPTDVFTAGTLLKHREARTLLQKLLRGSPPEPLPDAPDSPEDPEGT